MWGKRVPAFARQRGTGCSSSSALGCRAGPSPRIKRGKGRGRSCRPRMKGTNGSEVFHASGACVTPGRSQEGLRALTERSVIVPFARFSWRGERAYADVFRGPRTVASPWFVRNRDGCRSAPQMRKHAGSSLGFLVPLRIGSLRARCEPRGRGCDGPAP